MFFVFCFCFVLPKKAFFVRTMKVNPMKKIIIFKKEGGKKQHRNLSENEHASCVHAHPYHDNSTSFKHSFAGKLKPG